MHQQLCNSGVMTEAVYLYVYDLSQGMAKLMSRQMTGIQLDGIWHTSIVIFNVEYYFGQGICTSHPGQTHHGAPLQRIHLGDTGVNQEVFNDYIASLKSHWTADKYHLLDNNCNSFTNEVCLFLLGKNIPVHITNLPAQFLNTPLGMALRPFIENIFGPTSLSTSENATRSAQFTSSNAEGSASLDQSPILSSLTDFEQIITANKCAIAFFTLQTCHSSKLIFSEFKNGLARINHNLAQSPPFRGLFFNETKKKQIKVVYVDMEAGADIASVYAVTSSPTFIFFMDGKQTSLLKGANLTELNASMRCLVDLAYPSHSHTKINMEVVFGYNSPVLYKTSSNVDQIHLKMTSLMKNPVSIPHLAILKMMAKSDSFHPAFPSVLEAAYQDLAIADLFPLLDLMRLIVNQAKARIYLIENSDFLMAKVFPDIVDMQSKQGIPRAVAIMALRLACNMFQDAQSIAYMLSLCQNNNICQRAIITALTIECLLHPEEEVRKCAAGLVYNIAISASFNADLEDETLFEEWCLEMIIALVNALEKEKQIDVVLRMLVAFARLTYKAPKTIIDMLHVLDLERFFHAKSLFMDGIRDGNQEEVMLCREVLGICLQLVS